MATPKKRTAPTTDPTAKLLAKFDKQWQTERSKAEGYSPSAIGLEPGRYVVMIEKMELTTSKNGSLQLCTTYRGVDGDVDGTQHRSWEPLDSEISFEILAKKLTSLGYDVTQLDIKELPAVLEQIDEEKPVVRIAVKDNDPYPPKVYINKVFDEDDGDTFKGDSTYFVKTYGDTEEEEPEEEETEEEEAPAPKKKAAKPEPEEEEEPEDDEEEEEPEEEEEGVEDDLDELSRAMLKKRIADEELGVQVTRGMKDDDIRQAMREAYDAHDEEEEDPEEEEEPEEEEVELEVGMQVSFRKGKAKKKYTGKVTAIDEDAETVNVKVGTKIHKDIPVGDLEG